MKPNKYEPQRIIELDSTVEICGETFKQEFYEDGTSKILTGGPCGPMQFDEHGNMM